MCEFPNQRFYDNKIITKVKVQPEETMIQNFFLPNKDFPSLFYNVPLGNEELENKSFINKEEVFAVFQIVNHFIKNKEISHKRKVSRP